MEEVDEEVKQEEEVVENKEEELEVQEDPRAKEDEMVKKFYMDEIENMGITDQRLIENLKYMMDLGYLNFRVNYNLLTRNKNDLVVAINKLCNNIVTDSMFEGK